MNQKHMEGVYAQMHMHFKILSEISLVSYGWVISSIRELGKSLLLSEDVEGMVEHPLNAEWACSAAPTVLCVINTVAEGTDLGTAPGQEGLGLLMW